MAPVYHYLRPFRMTQDTQKVDREEQRVAIRHVRRMVEGRQHTPESPRWCCGANCSCLSAEDTC